MQIGHLTLDKPLALAPMEDVTDIPFRLICKRLGADLLYTEFTSSEALIRDARKALAKIRVVEEERPVAVQIFGGVETSMEGAAAIAERANPDFIDINCGCWVKKVALREAGAGLLRDPKKFEAIVRSVIAGTKLPVTVKTRLGWNDKSIIILEIARMLEQIGVSALAVHCRTRDQGHRGFADWSWLEKLKGVVSIPIIGNGDVHTPEDVKRMFETGCDGVMIGRGAIQNPWIFQQAKHFLRTGEHMAEPSVGERIETCLTHLRLVVEERGEQRGVLEFRKHYAGYLRGLHSAAKVRGELMHFNEYAPVERRLLEFADLCMGEAVA
ncbi:MAG TPA: tRNA dihydrouridine synthase DusB [Candidatus Hydrogenedentes bacterium]|nr:tRNA dihydrouridine synthase DusB [Candidatus Hydrogenedentota bacterium]HRK35793.1 tRNA dihydrouridine synthase DusB [Candidatus Hydrogenedentota bacterium]